MGTLSIFQGELADGCSDLYARGFITADGNTNKFPLKMKEPCITEAITILKRKGLFPDHDSDDDEMVFGDDDFPSADDEAEAPAEAPAEVPTEPPAESPAAYVPKADLTPDQQKNLKKVVKEGGKRGVEIEGAADMGGLQYFCTSVDESQGDLDLMDHCIAAMNAQPVPGEEERKGCSGHIGKMIFSAGDHHLGVAAYIPAEMKGKLDATEWLKQVLGLFQGELADGCSELYARGFVKADSNANKFPLKKRALHHGGDQHPQEERVLPRCRLR